MALEFRQNSKYALLVSTSIRVRITPANGQPVHSSNLYEMHVTSAETNVASISSFLVLPVKVLTTFVKDSPIAQFIKSNLLSRHMEYEGPEVEQGNPWGYRHQFNIADSGYGVRGPRVQNDRAGEVGRTLTVKDFHLERIFVEEGVQVVHLSGLIAALSPQTSEFCVQVARYAKKNGTLISFDLNHRATFWENREEELREVFSEIASLSDILIGNEEDYQLCLGVEGPKAGGEEIEATLDAFKVMILDAKKSFPNVSVFANTLREVLNANEHLWGAIVFESNNWHLVTPRSIDVIDRIGGGDGFVGGLLYSILKEWEPSKWIQFAWATGALATTFLTDYAQPADEQMVWNVWEGNARVTR